MVLLDFHIPSQLFSYFKIFTEVRYGVDFSEMDFTDAVINSTIPTLLFHGDDDEWVPVSMSDLIASERKENFTYIRYENVGHVTSWNADLIIMFINWSCFLIP